MSPFERLLEHVTCTRWADARNAEPELIERVLEALASSNYLPHQFLRAAVRPPANREEWNDALDALSALGGSGAETRRALAQKPNVMQAIQGVAGLGLWLPESWTQLLIDDASEGSLDALVPQIALAYESGNERLDQLAELLRKAEDEKLAVPLAEVEKHLVERGEKCFGEIAARCGLRPNKRVTFSLTLMTSKRDDGLRLTAQIEADSQAGSPISVQLEQQQPRRVIPVGRIAPRDVPAHLAAVAAERGVAWTRAGAEVKKRCAGLDADALLTWLLSYGREGR